MSDEGIGVRLIEELEAKHELPPEVELMELGTGGLTILHAIRDRKKALFVDSALMGETPGSMRRFRPEEVVSQKLQPRMSLHEGDLLQTLALAQRLGECPEEVIIFGIEPESVESGQGLSACLESRLGEYVACLMAELSPGRA